MVKRLGSAGMIAGAMVSVLVCYTISLRVSAERAGVEELRAQIASDMKDIRALEAELRTRARLPQLQRWNDNVLALSAPTAKQYVDGPVQLAAFAPNAPAAAPQQPTTQLAVATEPSQMVQPPAARMTAPLHTVAYTLPAPQTVTVASTKVVTAAELVAAVAPKPARAEPRPAKADAKADPKPAKADPQPAKPEPKPTAKPAKEARPLPPVRIAEAKPKADPLGDLIGDLDLAAKAERKGTVKVAMQ